MNDIHTIQPSVNGINEVGLYLKKEAEPPFAIYIQKLLDELNVQWENVCKQVCDLPPKGLTLSCVQIKFDVYVCFPLHVLGLCKEVGSERRP